MANPNIFNTTSIVGGNAGWNLTATLTTLLMTVDTNKIVKINSILALSSLYSKNLTLYISGLGTGAAGVTTTGADSNFYIAQDLAVSANAPVELISQPIYMMEGDQLKGGSTIYSTYKVSVLVSYEVIDDA